MTAPTSATDTAREVAGRLTKAQRKMVLSAVTGVTSVCDALEKIGLFVGERCVVRCKGGAATFRTIPAFFTPLGLAVRTILQEATHD